MIQVEPKRGPNEDEERTTILREILHKLHDKCPSVDKLNELKQTLIEFRSQCNKLVGTKKIALVDIELIPKIGKNILEMSLNLQKIIHQCYEQTQKVSELVDRAVKVEEDNVLDQVELSKLLERVKLTDPEIMEKYDSLPRFHFGHCPVSLVGKVSAKA